MRQDRHPKGLFWCAMVALLDSACGGDGTSPVDAQRADLVTHKARDFSGAELSRGFEITFSTGAAPTYVD